MSVYNRTEVFASIRRVFDRLNDLSLVNDGVVTFNDRGLTVHTRLQLLFNLKFESEVDRLIYELVLTHAFDAEKLGPGAFDITLQKVTEWVLNEMDGFPWGHLRDSLDGILNDGGSVSNLSDVDWLVSQYASAATKDVRRMLVSAINLAGFAGRVVLEKSLSSTSSIELVRGYTFDVNVGFPIKQRFDNPRVVVIDGFVEGVHEINTLLEDAAKAKVPVLLFIRGLANDVLSTLKVNYDRGTLCVIPIVVKFDFEGINTLVDVAIVSSADLKSTAKGDLISTAKLSTSPTVDSSLVYTDRVVISHDSTSVAVHNHVSGLRERRALESEDTVIKLFDKRIKSLSPNHVVMRIPNDQNFVRNSQAIDYTLRAYKSMLNYGTSDFKGQKFLSSTLVASHIHASKCLSELRDLGAVVT